MSAVARPFAPGEHKGALYQLQLGYRVGDLVDINGPWDRYGRVIALRESGFHLIRGLGKKKPVGWDR